MTVDETLEAADRAGKVLMWLTLALVIVVVGTTIMVLVGVLDVRSRSDDLAQNAEVTLCQVEYRAEFEEARSDAVILVLEGLVAVAAGDSDTLAELVDTRSHKVTDRMTATGDAYVRAVRLASEDPDAFLRECQ